MLQMLRIVWQGWASRCKRDCPVVPEAVRGELNSPNDWSDL